MVPYTPPSPPSRPEGFPEAAASFRQIAAIEQLHGERFGLLATSWKVGLCSSRR